MANNNNNNIKKTNKKKASFAELIRREGVAMAKAERNQIDEKYSSRIKGLNASSIGTLMLGESEREVRRLSSRISEYITRREDAKSVLSNVRALEVEELKASSIMYRQSVYMVKKLSYIRDKEIEFLAKVTEMRTSKIAKAVDAAATPISIRAKKVLHKSHVAPEKGKKAISLRPSHFGNAGEATNNYSINIAIFEAVLRASKEAIEAIKAIEVAKSSDEKKAINNFVKVVAPITKAATGASRRGTKEQIARLENDIRNLETGICKLDERIEECIKERELAYETNVSNSELASIKTKEFKLIELKNRCVARKAKYEAQLTEIRTANAISKKASDLEVEFANICQPILDGKLTKATAIRARKRLAKLNKDAFALADNAIFYETVRDAKTQEDKASIKTLNVSEEYAAYCVPTIVHASAPVQVINESRVDRLQEAFRYIDKAFLVDTYKELVRFAKEKAYAIEKAEQRVGELTKLVDEADIRVINLQRKSVCGGKVDDEELKKAEQTLADAKAYYDANIKDAKTALDAAENMKPVDYNFSAHIRKVDGMAEETVVEMVKKDNNWYNTILTAYAEYVVYGANKTIFEFNALDIVLLNSVKVAIKNREYLEDRNILTDITRKARVRRKTIIRSEAGTRMLNITWGTELKADENGDEYIEDKFSLNDYRLADSALLRSGALTSTDVVVRDKKVTVTDSIIQLTVSGYENIVGKINNVLGEDTDIKDKILNAKDTVDEIYLNVALDKDEKPMMWFGNKEGKSGTRIDILTNKPIMGKVDIKRYLMGAASPSGQRQGKILYYLVEDLANGLTEEIGIDRWNEVFNTVTNGGIHFGDNSEVEIAKLIKTSVRALACYAPSKGLGNVDSFAIFNGANGKTDGFAFMRAGFSDFKSGDSCQGRVLNTKCFYLVVQMQQWIEALKSVDYKVEYINTDKVSDEEIRKILSHKDGKVYVIYSREREAAKKGILPCHLMLEDVVPDIFTDHNGMKAIPNASDLGTDKAQFNMLDMPKPSDFASDSATSLTIFTQLAYVLGEKRAVDIARELTLKAVREKMAAKLDTNLGHMDVKDPDAYVDLRQKAPSVSFCYNSLFENLISNMSEEVVNSIRKMHFEVSGAYCRATAEIGWSWFSEENIDELRESLEEDARDSFNPVATISDKLIYENESYIPELAEVYEEMDNSYDCVLNRIAYGIKYPDMGIVENFKFHVLSEKDIIGRINENVESEEVAKFLTTFYKHLNNCVIVMPSCAETMDMLAGMDYDYDGLTIIIEPEIVQAFMDYANKNPEKSVNICKKNLGAAAKFKVKNDFKSMHMVTLMYAFANSNMEDDPSYEEIQALAGKGIKAFERAVPKSIGIITNYNVTNNILLIMCDSIKDKTVDDKKAFLNELWGRTMKSCNLLGYAHKEEYRSRSLEFVGDSADNYRKISKVVPYHGIGTPFERGGELWVEHVIIEHTVEMAKDNELFERMASCCWTVGDVKAWCTINHIDFKEWGGEAKAVEVCLDNFTRMLLELNDVYRGYQELQIDSAKTALIKKVLCVFVKDTAKCCGVSENPYKAEKQLDDFFYVVTEAIVKDVEATCESLTKKYGKDLDEIKFGPSNNHKLSDFCMGFDINKYYERIGLVKEICGCTTSNKLAGLDLLNSDDIKVIRYIATCYGAVAVDFRAKMNEFEEIKDTLDKDTAEERLNMIKADFSDDKKVLSDMLVNYYNNRKTYLGMDEYRKLAAQIGIACEYVSAFTEKGEEKETTSKFFWNVGAEFWLVAQVTYFESKAVTVNIENEVPVEMATANVVKINGNSLMDITTGEFIGTIPFEAPNDEEFIAVRNGKHSKLVCNASVPAMMIVEGQESNYDNNYFACFKKPLQARTFAVGDTFKVRNGIIDDNTSVTGTSFIDAIVNGTASTERIEISLWDGEFVIKEVFQNSSSHYDVVRVEEVIS